MNKGFLLLCVVFLGVVGCNSKKQPTTPSNSKASCTATLKINIKDEPGTLDPRKARSLSDCNVIKMFMEGLTRIDCDGKVSFALAKSVEVSDDQLLYTFHLRETTWSNGETVSANDFVYAWKKTLSPKFPSDQAAQLYPIRNARSIKEGKLPLSFLGVKALDAHTLAVKLENPTPYFLELLATPVFFPVCAKVDRVNPNWAQNAESFVGCGPFKLKTWKHHNQMKAVKNSNYWDKASVKLGTIEMAMVDEKADCDMFESGELHWGGSPYSTIPLDAIPALKKQQMLKSKPALHTYWVRANVEQEPFNHPKLRKAFSSAINRQTIVQHILQGLQIPAKGIVPSSMGLQNNSSFIGYSLESAQSFFHEGKEDLNLSEFPSIHLLYASGGRNGLIAQTLQEQWHEAFGIRVELETAEPKVFFDRVRRQDFQLALGNWVADFNDPINFLEVFAQKDNGRNSTGWENADYASSIERSYEIADRNQRAELLAKCEKQLMEEMPVFPLYHNTFLYMQDDHLQDVVLTEMGGIDFKWASLK